MQPNYGAHPPWPVLDLACQSVEILDIPLRRSDRPSGSLPGKTGLDSTESKLRPPAGHPAELVHGLGLERGFETGRKDREQRIEAAGRCLPLQESRRVGTVGARGCPPRAVRNKAHMFVPYDSSFASWE
ncbi:hypothetical protein K466DRAFT_606364 [Polyporus arcularius HHB13444]|uniref:Uncharacterized protein n=1 Tax=Polyporus arcularius HHB13444 TaxID=1314778 RepID=A0A5C3NQ43_9APHY|nr:hypothetical protein K466DRAFT_606364 [Polyporus arcularius HHB13444]